MICARLYLVAVVVGAAITGCASGPPVVPFRGLTPQSILVVPSNSPLDGGVTEELDDALAAMLREHGYVAFGGGDAVGKLVAAGWDPRRGSPDALPLEALRERFGVEAVWISEVAAWSYRPGTENAFSFDLRCRLVATRDARELWTHQLRGSEQTVRRRSGPDPFADPDPFEADNPISWAVVYDVLSPAEVSVLAAREFGARLPSR